MKKTEKFLIETSVLLTAASLKAKKAGKSIKEYFYEDETIKHISLVLYDLLPLSVKIGMRYEKFHEIFERNFKGIRNALLGKEVVSEPVKEPVKTSKRKVTSKVKAETIKTEETPKVKRVRKPAVKQVKLEK